MSLMNGSEARNLDGGDKITATCMLCPNRGVRAAMKPFGNGVICDPCAAKVSEAREAGFNNVIIDQYDKSASALGFSRVVHWPTIQNPKSIQNPIIEPIRVLNQKRSWQPFGEFVAMAFIIAIIFVAFVIAGD